MLIFNKAENGPVQPLFSTVSPGTYFTVSPGTYLAWAPWIYFKKSEKEAIIVGVTSESDFNNSEVGKVVQFNFHMRVNPIQNITFQATYND